MVSESKAINGLANPVGPKRCGKAPERAPGKFYTETHKQYNVWAERTSFLLKGLYLSGMFTPKKETTHIGELKNEAQSDGLPANPEAVLHGYEYRCSLSFTVCVPWTQIFTETPSQSNCYFILFYYDLTVTNCDYFPQTTTSNVWKFSYFEGHFHYYSPKQITG